MPFFDPLDQDALRGQCIGGTSRFSGIKGRAKIHGFGPSAREIHGNTTVGIFQTNSFIVSKRVWLELDRNLRKALAAQRSLDG